MLPQAADQEAPSPHVVLVDDDPSVRQALKRLLRIVGFQVTTYASADEYLSSPNPERQDCLILDVQMPGLNGLELQKVLTSMRTPLPIILMTAHPDEDLQTRAMEMGAVGFLEKPFDDQALIELIDKALHRP